MNKYDILGKSVNELPPPEKIAEDYHKSIEDHLQNFDVFKVAYRITPNHLPF